MLLKKYFPDPGQRHHFKKLEFSYLDLSQFIKRSDFPSWKTHYQLAAKTIQSQNFHPCNILEQILFKNRKIDNWATILNGITFLRNIFQIRKEEVKPLPDLIDTNEWIGKLFNLYQDINTQICMDSRLITMTINFRLGSDFHLAPQVTFQTVQLFKKRFYHFTKLVSEDFGIKKV